jgi:toxin YoeB
VRIEFAQRALSDLAYFETHQPKIVRKIEALLQDIARTPYRGIGKPEPLKHNYAGYWSRRISGEHRLVYTIQDGTLYIVQCRFHYDTK